MGIVKIHFCCQSNGYPFLRAICYFHAKTINMYSTIKHKSMFQKLRQKYRTSNLAFLGHSSLPDGSAVCLLPFTTAGGARCVLFIFSSWLGLGWTWASNIYVHKIHSLRSILVG